MSGQFGAAGRAEGTAYSVGHPEPITLHRTLGLTGRRANLMVITPKMLAYLDVLRRDIDRGRLTNETAAAQLAEPNLLRYLRSLPTALRSKGPGTLPPFFAAVTGPSQGRDHMVVAYLVWRVRRRIPRADCWVIWPAPRESHSRWACHRLSTARRDARGVHPPDAVIDPQRFFHDFDRRNSADRPASRWSSSSGNRLPRIVDIALVTRRVRSQTVGHSHPHTRHEGMIREDATIDSGALYDVANVLGMSDQQVRLCIKRLIADGQFTQEGRGRKAVLRATNRVRSTITPDREYVRYMYCPGHRQRSVGRSVASGGVRGPRVGAGSARRDARCHHPTRRRSHSGRPVCLTEPVGGPDIRGGNGIRSGPARGDADHHRLVRRRCRRAARWPTDCGRWTRSPSGIDGGCLSWPSVHHRRCGRRHRPNTSPCDRTRRRVRSRPSRSPTALLPPATVAAAVGRHHSAGGGGRLLGGVAEIRPPADQIVPVVRRCDRRGLTGGDVIVEGAALRHMIPVTMT